MMIAETPTDKPLNDSESKPQLRRYLLAASCLPLCLYLVAFVIVRLPSFERWGGSFYGPVLDYGFQAAGVDADVLIFGDSSALYDISPVQMSEALGVKVINLPNTMGSLPVTQDMALRHYLAANKKPRLIIFYFATWNLDYAHDTPSSLIYEGEEMLARHGSPAEIAEFARKDPSATLLFPFRFYGASPKAAFMSLLRHQDRVSAVAASYGHRDATFDGKHLKDSCRIPDELLQRNRLKSAQALDAKYFSAQSRVMFYIAPVPDCSNVSPVVSRSYGAIFSEPPVRMHPSAFWDDGFYAHVDPGAVTEATKELTAAVLSAMSGAAGRR